MEEKENMIPEKDIVNFMDSHIAHGMTKEKTFDLLREMLTGELKKSASAATDTDKRETT